MTGMTVLRDMIASMRPDLESAIPPENLALIRAAFDQLHAEADEAGMDPILFGAAAVANLVATTEFDHFESVALISLMLQP